MKIRSSAGEITTNPQLEPDAQQQLATALNAVLALIPMVNLDPKNDAQTRDATRYLYEQIMNYRGLLRKRPLTRNIEFLVPAGEASAAGWYYRAAEALTPSLGAARSLRSYHHPTANWHGPFPSRKAAQHAAEAHLPRTRAALQEQEILALAE